MSCGSCLGVPTATFGDFEWDTAKADVNLAKHGVSFEEAASALLDPHALYLDASASDEQRFAAIGISNAARALYVIHVERKRGERDRIISARLATASEEALYAEG